MKGRKTLKIKQTNKTKKCDYISSIELSEVYFKETLVNTFNDKIYIYMAGLKSIQQSSLYNC